MRKTWEGEEILSRKILIFIWIGELCLFVLSVGAVSYCAGKQEWGLFSIFVLICLVLFAGLKYLQSEPILTRLKKLEQKEFSLANRFANWGIRSIFNMQDNKELQERNIANLEMIERGNIFSLMAESGASYIDPSIRRHWDALKIKIDQGFSFRILLLEPFCSSKKIRNDRNQVRSSIDPKLKLEAIATICKSYDNVEVRFTNEPYCSLFFTDNEMIYDPYHLGQAGERIENYFLAIMFERKDGNKRNFYNLLKDHFDYLWSNGIRMNDFIRKYNTELSTDIISLFETE